jgi:hypothetical protein
MARRNPHERAEPKRRCNVYALSRADQLRLFAALPDYLGDEVRQETAVERQIA